MSTVTIEKNKKSPPPDTAIRKAMATAGGAVSAIDDRGTGGKYVTFTGQVNHNTFQNALEKEGQGNKLSWNFAWGDAA